MTMFVDRRKDNYDELLVLASDARQSRSRTNRWTTGLVVTAMLGTAAYVAAMSQQVEAMRETAKDAQGQRDLAVQAYQELVDNHNVLKAQVDAVQRYEDFFADMSSSTNLSNAISGLRFPGPSGNSGDANPTVVQQTIAKSNIVWMVDGSRRFPMIDGDILWVPEGNFWIHLEKEPSGRKLYMEDVPGSSGTASRTLLDPLPYRKAVTKGSHRCIEIQLHSESLRPIFRAQNYVDVEVTYYTPEGNDPC